MEYKVGGGVQKYQVYEVDSHESDCRCICILFWIGMCIMLENAYLVTKMDECRLET